MPVRLSFGDREYLDRLSLTAHEFYELLAESDEAPLTSQPPAQDFARVYSLLTSHGYTVISVGLSQKLSGTTAAALQAAGRDGVGEVRVIDTLSASTGQGLLAMMAAEAALDGMSADAVEDMLAKAIPRTQIFCIANDLSFAVKGGRVPGWAGKLTQVLRINPVLTASGEGTIGFGGVHPGRGANPERLARTLIKKMAPDTMYRVLISHANNEAGGNRVRHHVLEKHGRIHSCHVTDAGPALGVHLGPGGLIAAITPQPEELHKPEAAA